ncbi:MAG: ribulose-bisphosphate carboxylase large chain [Paracoccaceae bacterium]
MQADGPNCPSDDRIRAVREARDRHARTAGRKAMHAANRSGELDEMKRRAGLVAALGGACLMVSMHGIGRAGLRDHVSPPLDRHRNGLGLWSRS